jgi:hypothetical protein
MEIKKFGDWKVNELSSQSATKPIESDGGEPTYSYGNIQDILGSKYNFTVSDAKLKEFEETILSKEASSELKNDAYFAKRFIDYNRNKHRLTPPFQDDLIQNNDFYARAFYDEQDTKNDAGKHIKYMKYRMKESTINEDGVACASGGNVSGMGAVITSQPSAIPGDTGGATTGSGDIGAGTNRNVIARPNGSRRKKKMKAQAKEMAKNFANQFKGDEYKQGGDKGVANIMSFTDYNKKGKN